MAYIPKPIDTSNIKLPQVILDLTELLAKNSHENWAALRLSEGWQYGPKRDDGKKRHPCLISYDELPDSEKEYDRKSAMETLKVIIACGYKIEKPK
jgi:hypothetical protein